MSAGRKGRWQRRGFAVALLSLAAIAVGCGPWLTPIPTYWPPRPGQYARLPELPPATPQRPPRTPHVIIEKVSPQPRASDTPDVVIPEDTPEECLSIYTITSSQRLYAFSPVSKKFTLQGQLKCPAGGFGPFSMAVSKDGIAYVLYQSGKLFQVDVRTAQCTLTPYVPNQPPGFRRFGMAFAADDSDEGESLYVVEISFVQPSKGLARLDTHDFRLHYIGPLSQHPGFSLELSPKGNGPLSGYFINHRTGGTLVEFDKSNGRVAKAVPLNVGTGSTSLAISFWGDAYYIFTQHWRGTVVTRYDVKNDTAVEVATLSESIVGAGVSTCAPTAENDTTQSRTKAMP